MKWYTNPYVILGTLFVAGCILIASVNGIR